MGRQENARALNSELDHIRAHLSTLTLHEWEVFELVTRWKTNKEVARALG